MTHYSADDCEHDEAKAIDATRAQEATMRQLRCPACGVPHETSQECPD